MACQSAWAAVRTKNCYLSNQFKRLAARRGSKRALIAVAHSLLVIGYHLQSKGCVYQELGGDYFDQLHAERLKRHLVKRLMSRCNHRLDERDFRGRGRSNSPHVPT
jgi:hypothetical protein